MRNHLIAIQGAVASFHDLAAKKYFGEDIALLECGSFKEVCDKIANNKADYGIIAIENRVAGSILLNYQLIEIHDLNIIGETYLPIELHLMAKHGVELSQIKEIISHPMALGQSQLFLSEQEGITITEFKDTSSCAKIVANDHAGSIAVIGGRALAKTHNLKVIKENVCDVKHNFTRFYILSKGADFVEDSNKASITLQTANVHGKLSEVLSIIKDHRLNLTKIQSVPSVYDENTYSFHLDVEFDTREQFDTVFKILQREAINVKVLGIYKDEKRVSKRNHVNVQDNLN